MSSKEDLAQAMQRFEEKTKKAALDQKAKADEFKSLISDKMKEISGWVPEVNGIQKMMGPSVNLGGMTITSLQVKVLENEVLISPHFVDGQYSIKVEGLYDGVQYFQYSDQDWTANDHFLDESTKLTPEFFYQHMIKLVPK